MEANDGSMVGGNANDNADANLVGLAVDSRPSRASAIGVNDVKHFCMLPYTATMQLVALKQ